MDPERVCILLLSVKQEAAVLLCFTTYIPSTELPIRVKEIFAEYRKINADRRIDEVKMIIRDEDNENANIAEICKSIYFVAWSACSGLRSAL